MRFLTSLLKSSYKFPRLHVPQGFQAIAVSPPFFSQFLNWYKPAEEGEEEDANRIGTEKDPAIPEEHAPDREEPHKGFDPVDDDDRMGADHE